MYGTGDVIKLSALSIMQAHNTTELDCVILDARKYQEAGNLFVYDAYVCAPSADPNANPYMVLFKTVGSTTDVTLYHLDKGVATRNAAPFVLTPDGSDLLAQFPSYVTDGEGNEHELVWVKTPSGSCFGVRYADSDTKGIKTIAEFTTDATYFRPRCFVDWSGDASSGWLECWYGEIITAVEVSLSHAAKPI